MRRRWMRRIAVILVLCLLLNDNLTGLFIKTQAVEQDSPVASVSMSEIDSISPEKPEESTEAEGSEEFSEVSDGDAIGEESTEESEEILEESLETYDANQNTFPSTVEEYLAAKNQRSDLRISTAEDFINAQNLCEVDGFKGSTITIDRPSDSNSTWNMSTIEGFEGIGTAEHPFRGTLTSVYGNQMLFQIDKPLLAYMGNGAQMIKMNIACQSSSSAVAGTITGDVTLSNVTITGTIAGDGSVGLFASSMESDSSVTASRLTVTVGSINGANAGGFAGIAGDGVEVSISSSSVSKITVTASESAGGCFGELQGSYTYDVSMQDDFPVKIGGGRYCGQVVGKVNAVGEQGILTINGSAINVEIEDGNLSGGLIGYALDDAQIVLSNGSLTINGTVKGSTCGGVFGQLEGGGHRDEPSKIEFQNYTINATIDSSYIAGGLVGFLGWGTYIIDDVTISNVMGDNFTGGLIGKMGAAVVEVQKTITINNVTGNNKVGLLVGAQEEEEALIYLAEPGLIGNTVTGTSASTLADCEIGDGGSVFRNHNVSGGRLIGDGTLEQVGYVNYTVGQSGGYYQLKSAIDFECLAIALTTGGKDKYQKSAFTASYDELLTAKYQVTRSVDISYVNTGIVTLNRNVDRNVEKDSADGGFAGTMEGTSAGITITQNNDQKQKEVGLFTSLAGVASISNLTFDGTISNAEGVGGIAYKSYCTSLTLENITMKRTLEDNTGYIGGVLAVEKATDELNLTVDTITLASTIDAGDLATYSGFITEMDWVNIDIQNVTLGGSITGTSSDDVGGFLGRTWTLIGGKIYKLKVNSGTTYTTSGRFGGLVTVITNDAYNDDVETSKGGIKRFERVVFDTIDLNYLTIDANGGRGRCGLLMQDASKVVAEVIDYTSEGCVVNNPGYQFDEIAGRTKSNTDATTMLYKTGIISLHRTDDTFPNWHYENQVDSLKYMKNRDTVYYYDVFQILEDSEGNAKEQLVRNDGHIYDIDSPAKYLVWHLAHAANDHPGKIFGKYFKNSNQRVPGSNEFRFKGTVDVSQICVYPTPKVRTATFACQDNAKIIFGATEEMESWTLNNVSYQSQHYGLQGGLFYNYEYDSYVQNLTISDLTLSGTIANLGKISGGLLVGRRGLDGGGTFTNITLDGLRICGYDEDTDAGAALLISEIPDNKVVFENIVMTGYDDVTGKVASSLIGAAGSDTAANLVLSFHNMQIADGKTVEHNGTVLSHASFLYSYDYTDDVTINKGSGIYLFSEDDAKNGLVTYGEELTLDTEFSDNEKIVLTEMGIKNTDYIPYVYTTEKKIEVNPKTGDILKGCGTYEDPYMIETVKQFLTLYRYMNDELTDEGIYQYDAFYKSGLGWKIVKPGDDSTFCTATKGQEHPGVVTFGNTDFPTPDVLSRAYYQLGANIDLSDIESTTYQNIAADFVGFGTEKQPFVGVWYGANHTLTLPDKYDEDNQKTKTFSNYGLIQYAQGAVVKDITISMPNELAKAPTITGSAGSVIATILGGDNIIDNVKVQLALNAADANIPVGGYVGVVKKGGLILREVEESDFTFACNNPYSDTGVVGAIVGKVEDGFVVYEGGSASTAIWNGVTKVDEYAAIPGYSILNADYLKTSTLDVTITEDTTTNRTTVFRIPDAAGLQVMSMALNADALNVSLTSSWAYKKSGYSEKSRCRKAKYDAIGTTTKTTDYENAAKYDNVMNYNSDAKKAVAYPYLYDFMGITSDDYGKHMIWSGEFTILNPTIDFGDGKVYHATWELAENSEYDMSQFGAAFRGIGALYQTGNGYGGTFHGDFNGNGSTITLGMNRMVAEADQGNGIVARAGLFNTVWCNGYVPSCEFKDVTITGSIQGRNLSSGAMGGLAASLTSVAVAGNFNIENVMISSLTLGNAENHANMAGGLVGSMEKGTFTVTGVEGTPISVSDSSISGVHSGGVLGYAQTNATVTMDYVECTGSTIGTDESVNNAGGIAGFAGGGIQISNANCEDVDMKAYANIGGVIGDVGAHDSEAKIANVTVSDLRMEEQEGYNGQSEGLGGVVGRNGRRLSISDATVQGTSDESFQIQGQAYYRTAVQGVGGLVGCHNTSDDTLNLKNCTVDGLKLDTTERTSGTENRQQDLGVGGLVGLVSGPVLIDTAKAKDMDISVSYEGNISKVLAVGGGFGYVTGDFGFTVQDVTIQGNMIQNNCTYANMQYAGGFIGYWKQGATSSQASKLTVEENQIIANTTGGFLGGYEAAGESAGHLFDSIWTKNLIVAECGDTIETNSPAVGGLVGRTIASNIAASLHCDHIVIESSNQIGVRKDASSKVQLVEAAGVETTYTYADIKWPTDSTYVYEAIDALEAQFGSYVGVWVGVWEAEKIQMYVTDTQDTETRFQFPVMAENPPVVDVGRKPRQTVDDYRNYCHVIYGAQSGVANEETRHLADVKEQVDVALGEYANESAGSILTKLRASKESMELFGLSYQENYAFPGTELTLDFPILVYRVKNGTMQEVMENVTDMMTNVAGNSASDVKILSVDCKPLLYDGSTFTEGASSVISATIADGIATYERSGYDGVVDGQLTYTKMIFRYNNGGKVKEFVVPVFVEEPILYSVHSKIMEGNVSDVVAIRENGISEFPTKDIVVDNDSKYTLLLEYTYGAARQQMPDGVSAGKQIYLWGVESGSQEPGYKHWPIGTQLLLIDVTGGNKAYYYEVTEGTTILDFTKFTDSDGNHYVDPSMNVLESETDAGQSYYTDLEGHQLTDTAVERFLLTVYNSDTAAERQLYSLHAGLAIADESLKSRFELVEEHHSETVWNIVALPGLDVSLDDEKTSIDGSISKTEGVTVTATFQIVAKDDQYWIEHQKEGVVALNSANNSKYLEVAFYLRNEEGRVALPMGTNFSYAVAEGSQSVNKVVADNSIVYYYKDIRTLYGDENSVYQMGALTKDTTETLSFVLDFAGADLSTVLDESYEAWIELLRTGNPNYPMGNGNHVDSFKKDIEASASQELGFALRATNSEQLGINTYPIAMETNTIDGEITFDFTEQLELAEGVAGDEVLEKWAGFDYDVTYRLCRKMDDGGYESYKGSNIKVVIPEGDALDIQSGTTSEGVPYWKGTYQFSTKQIQEKLLSFSCQIVQNTKDLVSDNDNLTNYRLEATLEIRERGAQGESSIQTTDFFIYTVTKLKFDL